MESGNLISKVKLEKNKLKSATRYDKIKADYFLQLLFNIIILIYASSLR